MQSTDMRQMKAALWNQAVIGGIQVRCPMGRVVAKRREERAVPGDDFGWGRWYPVESVRIERMLVGYSR